MSKKLKIAIIGSRGYPFVYSGYETLVKELSERLVKSGNEVTVYCHKKLFNKKPKKVNGINLVYTPSIKSKIFSQLYNSFFSFIHVCFSNNDIVFVVNSANGPFGILTKFFKKKTCINVDGLEWLRPKWKGIGSFYFRLSSKLATLFFDIIITDSIEMNKIYKEKFRKKSKVIAYGSTMVKTKDVSILKKLNIIKNNYYLIVGRLVPDNNAMTILEAFKKINSDKKIVIVGDVPYDDEYSVKIKSMASNKILFTGYINCQKELSSLYLNSFGYIHGHEYGGTNPTMINAIDLKCEIIALNTIFNKEMLAGRKAIFFEKNILSISEAFILFEKKYSVLKSQNKNYKIPKKYLWEIITKEYNEVFFQLTNCHGK